MSRFIYVVIAVIAAGVLSALWIYRRRRPPEEGFQFVYINQDGSARELTASEREYLDTDFQGADGGRPYVKSSYESKDGWGSISGFIERRKVPAKIQISKFVSSPSQDDVGSMDDMIAHAETFGDAIELGAGGSSTITPTPALDTKEQFRLLAERQLLLQRNREDAVMRFTNDKRVSPTA